MRVRQGWSGEVAPGRWAKFDITLEEDDLYRLVANAFGPDFDTDNILDDIPVRTAFKLLETEAEILVLSKLVVRYGMPAEEANPQLNALSQRQNELYGQIRDGKSQV